MAAETETNDIDSGDGAAGGVDVQWLLSNLPPDVLGTFSPEQRAALWQAAHAPSWRRYPVNIRLNMPFFGTRYFLTLVAGADRRNAERRLRERRLHPLRTVGNLVFVLAAIGCFYLAAVALLFLGSALVEF